MELIYSILPAIQEYRRREMKQATSIVVSPDFYKKLVAEAQHERLEFNRQIEESNNYWESGRSSYLPIFKPLKKFPAETLDISTLYGLPLTIDDTVESFELC